MTVTWKLLRDAYEHVLTHELSPEVTKWRLRQELMGGRVRSRGFQIIFGSDDLDERGGMQNLEPEFWRAIHKVDWDTGNVTFSEHATFTAADGDQQELHIESAVYRIEVCWPNLIAIWPLPEGGKPGRRRQHSIEEIRAMADSYVKENGVPRSVRELADVITRGWPADRSRPKPTWWKENFGPWLEQLRVEQK